MTQLEQQAIDFAPDAAPKKKAEKLTLCRQGAGRLKLNKAALKKAIPMLVPDEKEQKRSFERFTSAENRTATETTQSKKLLKLKSGLMQDLLTGKVRVKVDEAEEACAHA